MSISVNVSSPAVQAVVTSAGISASVHAAQAVAASIGGGFGPTGSQGPQGIQGPVGPTGPQGPAGVTTLANAEDVAISNVAAGDVLRYASGAWRNFPETDLLDAGSF